MNATSKEKHAAADAILLAGITFDDREFSMVELVMAAWALDPERFGLHGFEKTHPSSHRVSMEIMGNKASSPIKRGFMIRSRPNHYRVTPLGRSNAVRILNPERMESDYMAVRKFMLMGPFMAWKNDPCEPRTSIDLHASALGEIELVTTKAMAFLREKKIEHLVKAYKSGLSYVPQPIHWNDLVLLKDFVAAMRQRFSQLAGRKARSA